MDPIKRTTQSRRTFLVGAGALLLASCTDSESGPDQVSKTSSSSAANTTRSSTAPTTAVSETTTSQSDEAIATTESLTPAMFDELAVCALTAEASAGPFPTESPLNRREVHEGYPGHPLRLGIRVVDQSCQPIPNATVEIWHADASGDYSEFEDGGSGKDEGEGSTFCRGIQTADADGILEFLTIYPGWYPNRAVHIHASVDVGGEDVLTCQLYFDELYTEAVYQTGEYAQFGLPDTTWANDRLADDPTADGSIISLTESETSLGVGTLGLVNLGVVSP